MSTEEHQALGEVEARMAAESEAEDRARDELFVARGRARHDWPSAMPGTPVRPSEPTARFESGTFAWCAIGRMQVGEAPPRIELLENHRVRFNGGRPHGCWVFRGSGWEAQLRVEFHYLGDVRNLQTHVLHPVVGTVAWMSHRAYSEWSVMVVPLDDRPVHP